MALRLTSFIGVGYSVLQCKTVRFFFFNPAFIRIFIAAFISFNVAIPVDITTGLFKLPIFRKYGKFVISPERAYIHAASDRLDSQYDTIRAVRDSRFKYLRNYNLDRSYYLALPFREQMAIMKELLRLNDSGELNEIQQQWFRLQKPPEELFDTTNDSHELINLASDSAYSEKLNELSQEMDDWVQDINDLGLIPENEMIEQFWPDRVQPVTQPPIINLKDGNLYLSSETEGANIAYQIISGEQVANGTWQVYSKPLRLSSSQRLIAIAHRIGFAPSEEINFHQN